jgi:Zn-dependent peptidase ImmA (M78 family)
MTPCEVAEAYLNVKWDGNLPIFPEVMAVNDGLSILSTDDLNRVDGCKLAGLYMPSYNSNPAIFVNHRDTYTKRRFDCAIGLGHYILGHGQSIGGMNFDLTDIYVM